MAKSCNCRVFLAGNIGVRAAAEPWTAALGAARREIYPPEAIPKHLTPTNSRRRRAPFTERYHLEVAAPGPHTAHSTRRRARAPPLAAGGV